MKKSKKMLLGPVEAQGSSDGASGKINNGLNVRIAKFYLPGIIRNNDYRTGLSGSINGYWKDRRTKF